MSILLSWHNLVTPYRVRLVAVMQSVDRFSLGCESGIEVGIPWLVARRIVLFWSLTVPVFSNLELAWTPVDLIRVGVIHIHLLLATGK